MAYPNLFWMSDVETGDLSEFSSSSAAAPSGTQEHSGDYSLRLEQSGSATLTFSAKTEIVCRVWFYVTAVRNAVRKDSFIVFGTPASGNIALVRISNGVSDPTFGLTLWPVGGTETTLASSLSVNTWYRLEVRCKKGTGSDQEVGARLDGASEVKVSDGTTVLDITKVVISGGGTDTSDYIYCDDMVLLDTPTYPNVVSEMVALRPDRDSATSGEDDWLPATSWSVVDDDPRTDGTEADSNADPNNQLWTLTSKTIGTINHVRLGAFLHDEGGYGGEARFRADPGTPEDGPDITSDLLTSYSYHTWDPTTPPTTQSGLDSYEAGMKSTHGSKNLYCSEYYVMVDYTPDGGATYNEETTLAAVGALNTVGILAAFGGVTLNAAGSIAPGNLANLLGAGTLTADATLTPAGSLLLSLAAQLTAQAAQAQIGGLAVADEATLTADAVVTPASLLAALGDLTLTAEAALTPGSVLLAISALNFAAQAAQSEEGNIVLDAIAELTALAGLTPSGDLIIDVAIALSVAAEQAQLPGLALAESLSLVADAAEAPAATLTRLGAVSLPATASLTPSGVLGALGVLTLPASAGLTPAVTGQWLNALTLAASGAITAEALASIYTAQLTIAAQAGLTTTGGTALVESLTLAGQAAFTPGASLVLNLSSTLPADAGQTQAATLAVLGSVSLGTLAGLTVDSQAELVADIALDVTAAIAAAAQRVMEAWVSMGASAAAAQSAAAAYTAAVTLQAQAVLQAATSVGGVMGDFLISVVEALGDTNTAQCLASVNSVAALTGSDNTAEALGAQNTITSVMAPRYSVEAIA